MPAQDIQRSNVEVRNELYVVYAEIYLEKESHTAAFAMSPNGHPKPCEWCDRFDQRMIGVKIAIHHFGGKPRVTPKKCFEVAAARRAAAKAVILPWQQASLSSPGPEMDAS